MPPEQVASLARDLRDELDASGVADREADLRSKRFLKLTPMANGMTRISGQADPESAAMLKAAIDPITSPRRGGPRFVDPDDRARADAIVADPRTTEQLTLDAFVELVRVGAAADDGRLYGSRKPSVRMHVTLSDLEARRQAVLDGYDPASVGGIAWIEGETATVSLATAERHACADGYYPLVFDQNGNGMRLGRSRRNFSENQRIMLAGIWGGCAVEGCERPPSWTEVGLPGFDGHRDSGRGAAGRCSHGSGVLAGVQGSSRRVVSAWPDVQGTLSGVRSIADDDLELGSRRRQEAGRVAA